MKIGKSDKNKTIDFSEEEGKKYIEKCFVVNDTLKFEDIINKTILGDTFEVLQNQNLAVYKFILFISF